jgi:uncharacterized protein
MGKLLSWIAIGFAIYVAYKVVLALQRKSHLRRPTPPEDAREESGPASGGRISKPLRPLIACAHCGLQLPKDDALHVAGEYFCGEAHARLGVKPSGDA